MKKQRYDLTGKVFNRLTALHPGANRKNITTWVCKCECGVVKEFATSDILRGHSKSCGCYNRERVKTNCKTHGDTCGRQITAEYRIWCNMKERCTNKHQARYADYGGRGITVCESWLESFSAFLNDMGRKPSKRHSIDRIDNNQGYNPSNCRWATPTQQSRNSRTVKNITIGEETKNAYEWNEISGVNPRTILARLRLGWDAKLAVFTPANSSNKLVSLKRNAG